MNKHILSDLYNSNYSYIQSSSTTCRQIQLQKLNITIQTYGIKEQELQGLYKQIQLLGFTPINPHRLLQSIVWFIYKENIEVPTGKKCEEKRWELIESILQRMNLYSNDKNQFCISIITKDGICQDIFVEDERLEKISDDKILQIMSDPIIYGKVLRYIENYTNKKSLLAIVGNNIGQIPVNGPRLVLQQKSTIKCQNDKRKADSIINIKSWNIVRSEILQEIVTQERIKLRCQNIQKSICKGEIKLYPKFRLDNWPIDEMMSNVRRQVSIVVDKYIHKYNLLCDQQDLKYQTLFRLTTYTVSDVFVNGKLLEDYLQNQNVYSSWKNILLLDRQFIQQFTIKPNILKTIMNEQYKIIKERMNNSRLPLNQILNKKGLFAETGWVIKKKEGSIYAIRKNKTSDRIESVPIEFREIDPELAIQFHNDLHYIHTPRVDIAFGLYIKDESIPFSVLSLEKIDRIYKENVLLMHGYDPRYCYDLTRLYSRPGTPANTSSSIFSLTFSYIKNNYSQTQAVMSAFMPSYANGMSMTSGGFENPVLIKPLVHTFEEKIVNRIPVWEHLTKRRQQKSNRKKVKSKFPLLPTIELMAVLQNPRYSPIPEINEYMVELILD